MASLVKNQLLQIAQATRTQALEQGLLSEESLKKYDKIQYINREYYTAELNASLAEQSQQKKLAEAERQIAQAKFDQGLEETRKLSPEEQAQIAKLIALQTNMMSAVSNFEHSRSLLSSEQRFKVFLEDGISSGDAGGFIKRTAETLDKMIISTVFTMHPTLWHSPESRELEKRVTEILEERAQGLRPMEGKGLQIFPDEVLVEIKKELAKTIGQNLTPMKKVTIPMENVTEEHLVKAMRKQADAVINDWNKAVRQVQAESAFSMQNFDQLSIDDEHRKKILEFRTWGRESDADGRDASTSPGFSQWIRNEIQSGGPFDTRDMRDNSSQLIDVTSALIQTAYHRSKRKMFHGDEPDFYRHSLDFSQKADASRQVEKNWVGPDQSILQQLKRDAQSKFLQGIITEFSKPEKKEKFRLIPHEIQQRTLEFCDFFHDELGAFTKKRNLPEDTTFEQLAKFKLHQGRHRNLQTEFIERIGQKEFMSPGNGDGPQPYRYLLDKEGFYQANLDDKGKDLLEDRVKMVQKNGKWEQSKLSEKERRMLMDVVKRLIVVNDAIDKYGSKVADRYQIANFEDPSHFYALMLLMQQTGIMDIENGKVKSSKLAIQPLIETAQDRKNAVKIFSQLLKDDLGKSYFESISRQKGYVEIMMGFSDGAATGGNFASEWGIYKCMQDLSELFAEKGMKVRFLQGRGRGSDRGGLHEAGLEITSLPSPVIDMGILDVTRQSDQPQQGYISQASGKDLFASSMLGVLSARDRALTRTEPEKKRIASYEKACQFIADRAEKYYDEIVRSRPDGQQLVFFDAMPQNTDITSRGAKRNASDVATPASVAKLSVEEITEKFDKIRAITKEYRLRGAGMPAYDAGLKRALEDYLAESETNSELRVLSQDGKHMLGGKRALQEMYKDFDFFHITLDKIHLSNKEGSAPRRAAVYGEKTNTSRFVKEVCASLEGLTGFLDMIRAPALGRGTTDGYSTSDHGTLYQIKQRPSKTWSEYTQGARNLNPAQDAFKQLAHLSHQLMLSQDADRWNLPMNSEKPEDTLQAEMMRNCLFTSSVSGIQQGIHGQNDITLQVAAAQPSAAAMR